MRRDDEADVLRFLSPHPYENVLLEWLIEQDRSPSTRERLFVCRSSNGAVSGAAHFGRQVVLAARDPAAIAALANAAYAYRHERMIVASRSVAKGYWDAVKTWHSPPRLVRDNQPLLAVDRRALKIAGLDGLETRLARADEVDLVMENSAAMIEHELGYDPRRASSGFTWNVRRMIDRKLWWMALLDGRPSFFCHIGPFTARTVQLQGVWTVPQARSRGIATAALGQICSALFGEYQTVSLYVNDFNAGALALYATLGFTKRGALCTYLF